MRIPLKVARVLGSKNEDFYSNLYLNSHVRRLAKKFTTKDCIKIEDVRLPLLDREHENIFWAALFDDIFASYYYFNDSCDEKTVRLCENCCCTGLYSLENDKVRVQVNPGDVVIDAGSWIGDFAAYSASRGVTFAFEPSKRNFEYLQQTAELNPNIFPIKKGLSYKTTTQKFFISTNNSAVGDSLSPNMRGEKFEESSSVVETITLDDFVKEKNLDRIDFIKSGMGFEKSMLQGAQETLKKFAPKLALCTFYFQHDAEVMTDLIMQANPNYKIVYGKMKLYASV